MRLWLTLVLWLGSSLVLTEESPPPSKRHKCPDAPPSQHLLCYHEGSISIGDLDPCICTHLVLPSIESTKGYRLDEKVSSSALSDLRARNPSLRLLLGVDAGSRALHSASDKKVSDFCRETADYIKSANLDGLEVDLGDANDDSTHTKRKESVVSLFKSLRESVGQADTKESSDGQDPILLLRLPVRPEALAKTFDLKPLSKYVDYFTVSTHNITDSSEKDVTFHHSRLMGLADILNTDSVLDMLTGLGAPPSKLIISLPTHGLSFTLKNENENVARSPVAGAPKVVNYEQVCSLMKEGGWTVERDEDLTAPYAFRNKTWIAFDDETSVTIKGKYSLLRGLGGVAISTIDADDRSGACGRGPFPLTRVLKDTLTKLSRKPRGLILQSLEEELRGGVSVALPEASLDSSVRLSPFRIVRVVDREGNVHVTRRDAETRFHCSRQGYFMHPLGCNMFYRCVKFDQLSNDFSVYEYDCGPGLVFDEKWEVCVHPSQRSGPCHGSSEIQPVPRAKFTCPGEGYYADPENCRWFFACLDHHGDPSVAGRDATDPHSGLTAYEFRCPFGLAFDGSRLACEWPWTVPGCGKVEIGSGVLAAIQPTGYSVSGVGGVIGSVGIGGTLHHTSHVESGSVASIVGVADKGAGYVAGGGSQIRLGESGSVASIFSDGDAGHVASGGAKIDLGGVRFGSGHAGLGSSYVSHGPGFVTGRVGIVSQGAQLVSHGQNLVSSGAGLVSGGGGLFSGSGGLLSGAPGVVSSGAHLASGGAHLASGGAHLVSGGGQLLSEGVQVLSGGGQLLSGGARISNVRPVSGVESGSVASVFRVDKAGEATFSSGDGLAGVGVTIDDSHVTSGGSLYSSGGSRGSYLSSGSGRDSSFSSGGGRTSYYSSGGLRESQYHGGSSRGVIVSSEGADSAGSVHVTPGEIAFTTDGLGSPVGGAEVASGVAHSISSGEKILNIQSYQTPAVKFETSAPAIGVSYTSSSSVPTGGITFNLGHSIAGGKSFTSGSSIVTGAEGVASRNQGKPLEIVGVTSGGLGQVDNSHLRVEAVEANGGDVNGIGLSGVGVSGVGIGGASVGRFGISGVKVSGDGVSGIRGIGSGLALQSITTEAPTLVEVNRGIPIAPVVHSNYDDSSKYTVSISTPSTTSRPIPVVTTPVQLVTPAPIQYQSPQPAFLAHETYHSSAPATGSGDNSFSIGTGSLSAGGDEFSPRQPGSRAGATGSGRSSYSFRQRVDYQSHSNQPQYYHSPSGSSGTSSYSIGSGVQRTGGFIPIKPLVSSNVFTASESPAITLTHSPAFEAARVSSTGGSEGGSVVNALPQESLSSPNTGVLVDNSQDGIGFGLVRDDGHTITGNGASRPSLVGVQREYQDKLRSSVTAPEAEFSYKDIPLSIYQAAAPARSFDVSGVGSVIQQAPKRVFSTSNVTPAPVNIAVSEVHPSTFITPSTTPAYEEVNVDISRQLGNKEFSYKNIFPVVELSTPAPKVVDIPQVSIQNQLNFEKKTYTPIFTSTVSPPTSIGIDDGDYGSRIVYTNNAKQPVAFTSSHGNSGLRHFVQTESPAISYSPTLTQTTPIQHTQSVPVTPAPAVFVSTTPAPLSTLSYSKLPSTPIAPASPVYYVPQRGSSRQRYFSTTTASPILAEAFPGEVDSHQEVQFFEPNRVSQNIPITSTFGPPVGSLSLIPALNDSAFGGRALPAFKQSTFRGYGRLSTGDSDNEGPVGLPVGVQGSYENVLLKHTQVKDDDESQVPVIIDSINAGRGRYRYRGRNGRVRINGKKKCDDDDENRDEADVNADAILDSYSGSYGSILDNGDRGTLVQGVITEDLREKTSGSLQDYQGLNNPSLPLEVTVKSSIENGDLGRSRSRPRGRYQSENVNYHSNFKSSTAQPADYTSGVRNTYTLSTVPTVVPIVTSTVGYVSEGDYQTSGRNLASGLGDLQGEINDKYSGGLSEGSLNLGSSRRLSQGLQRGGLRVNSGIQLKSSNQRAELYSESSRKSSESSSSIDHAAVIVLPCGKLPALLAKLGAVTEALRSIQEEETSSTLKVTQERSRASLSLPPVDRYRNGDWNLIEKTLGNDMCKRAGLFRHPQDCNRFYECYWDEWKGRYSLHEFKCPIRLAYDDSLSACNWPTSGPACSANKLLV